MSQILLNIRSAYILKQIISIIDYNKILKLIKYNKRLQKSLEINFLNYKEISSYQYLIEKMISNNNCCCSCIKKVKPYRKKLFFIVFSGVLTVILFTFTLIMASVLLAKGAFNENNTKKNYNKNYSKIINIINLSLFGFTIYVIIAFYLV